jgi:MFS family permease
MAAWIVRLVGLGSIVGKAGGGWFSDRFGREVTYTLGMASVAAGVGALGLLALSARPGWAYVYGLLAGVGYAVTAPLIPAVVSDLFPGRNFGAIFGALHVANALGASLGPWVGGRVFDTTGSYAAAFVSALLTLLVTTLALWVAAPRRRRTRVLTRRDTRC